MFTKVEIFPFFLTKGGKIMNNKEIIKTVREIRNGDMSNFQAIYDAFSRLINCYGRRISEDGREDLTLYFIELLYSVDINKFSPDDSSALNMYIAVSLRNYYITLSQKAQKALRFCNALLEEDAKYIFEPEDALSLKDGFLKLSERQRTVLTYRYFYGFSDREISNLLCISRQAVHQLELRAIAVLKEYYGI